ncbi:MAG: tetratricopeptide repeat protein, partial [Pirellulaceae bacterium]|nr:tetratricopeptide repeat protein [Pirellulaceae bacterium]
TLADLTPHDAATFQQLGRVLYDRGRLDEATEACQKSLNIYSDSAATLTNLENIYSQLSKARMAIGSYEKALQVEPGYVKAYVGLGVVHASLMQDPDIATRHFRNALELDPDHFWTLHNLGSIHMKYGDYVKAIDYFKRTIDVDPSSVSAHGNLAYLHFELGEHEVGIRHLHKVLGIDPGNAHAKRMVKQLQEPNETTK